MFYFYNPNYITALNKIDLLNTAIKMSLNPSKYSYNIFKLINFFIYSVFNTRLNLEIN